MFLPKDENVIKQAILDHGALFTNMFWDDDNYRSSDYTYYSDQADSLTNHAVLLAGWDDDKVTAGATGAWIIKNSWGTTFGERGYFYISYRDAKINDHVVCWPEKFAYNDNVKIGDYDDLGWISSWGYSDGLDYGLMRYTPENETAKMIGT